MIEKKVDLCEAEKLIDERRGERGSGRRAHAAQQEHERKDRKENDRKDSGGRRVEVSGHCQLEDP